MTRTTVCDDLVAVRKKIRYQQRTYRGFVLIAASLLNSILLIFKRSPVSVVIAQR